MEAAGPLAWRDSSWCLDWSDLIHLNPPKYPGKWDTIQAGAAGAPAGAVIFGGARKWVVSVTYTLPRRCSSAAEAWAQLQLQGFRACSKASENARWGSKRVDSGLKNHSSFRVWAQEFLAGAG